MAIYSLNLSSIGKMTHRAGTAAAHIRYIARKDALPVILTQHMPQSAKDAARFFLDHERNSRKNARVGDKLRLALPIEHSPAQRAQLVQDFMADLTGNVVPWYCAIHQTGKDAHNPHAHVIVCDSHIENGKRTLGWSDSPRDWKRKSRPGDSPVQWIRQRWEIIANAALAAAGIDARIDRRTLEDQGIEREPQIHVGPNGLAAERRGVSPGSADKPVRFPSLKWQWRKSAAIPYAAAIDQGRSRSAANEARIAAAHVQHEIRMTEIFERASNHIDQLGRRIDSKYDALHQSSVREAFSMVAAVRAAKKAQACDEADALKGQFREAIHAIETRQRGLFSRIVRTLDITGGTRRRHKAEISAVKRNARSALSAVWECAKTEYEAQKTVIKARHHRARDSIQEARATAHERTRLMRSDLNTAFQRALQAHETGRERVWPQQPGGRHHDTTTGFDIE